MVGKRHWSITCFLSEMGSCLSWSISLFFPKTAPCSSDSGIYFFFSGVFKVCGLSEVFELSLFQFLAHLLVCLCCPHGPCRQSCKYSHINYTVKGNNSHSHPIQVELLSFDHSPPYPFHLSPRHCPSTAGCSPPSMSSIIFCLLLSCSRWFPSSLLCCLEPSAWSSS